MITSRCLTPAFVRQIAPVFFLFVLLPCLSAPAVVLVLIYAGIFVGCPLWLNQNKAPTFMLGAAVSLFPVFGSGSLLALCLVYILLVFRRDEPVSTRWAYPLVYIFGIWTVLKTVFAFNIPFLYTIFHAGLEWREIFIYLREAPPDFLSGIHHFVRFWVFVYLFSHFSCNSSARRAAAEGVVAGLVPSFILCVVQIFGIGGGLFVNQTGFWTTLGRWSGTFTDPNAFGIFSVLIIPLLLARAIHGTGVVKKVSVVMLPLWTAVGFCSGSRSYLLGLLIYCCLGAWRKDKRFFYFIAFVFAGLLLSLDAVRMFDPEFYLSFEGLFPAGSVRLIDALSLISIKKIFYSRFIFWKIGFFAWLDNLLFGVGFHNFHLVVPHYSSLLGIDIGSWTDNPNNYYLGILAETGIAGMASFISSVISLRLKEGNNHLTWRSGVYCFALLLFLGPHLDFDEVSVMAALVMGYALDIVPSSGREYVHSSLALGRSIQFKVGLGLIVFAAVAVKCFSADQGFYGWEKNEKGQFFRWSYPAAKGTLGCKGRQGDKHGINTEFVRLHSAKLTLRALNPDLKFSPLNVQIITGAGEQKSIHFSSPNPVEVKLSCGGYRRLRYTLMASRGWNPRVLKIGDDARILGVQVLGGL